MNCKGLKTLPNKNSIRVNPVENAYTIPKLKIHTELIRGEHVLIFDLFHFSVLVC